MTHHITHNNKMIFDLKSQYHKNISKMQEHIDEKDKQIEELNQLISILTQDRYYDC
jgi:prefoldin subunit 5